MWGSPFYFCHMLEDRGYFTHVLAVEDNYNRSATVCKKSISFFKSKILLKSPFTLGFFATETIVPAFRVMILVFVFPLFPACLQATY